MMKKLVLSILKNEKFDFLSREIFSSWNPQKKFSKSFSRPSIKVFKNYNNFYHSKSVDIQKS